MRKTAICGTSISNGSLIINKFSRHKHDIEEIGLEDEDFDIELLIEQENYD